MGITELLTVVFVALKLIGIITWSWWLVMLPEIIGFGIYAVTCIVCLHTHRKISRHVFKEFGSNKDW